MPMASECCRTAHPQANIRWNTLGYLASRFAPGGSLGADDKLFAFAQSVAALFTVHADARPYAGLPGVQLNGTTRFEHGVPVNEFKDLRANTR